MSFQSPHTYRLLGRKRGVPESVLDAAIAARESVYRHSRSLTPVLTLAHLAQLTNTDYAFLRQIVSRNLSPYYTFSIEKRNGKGSREISIPNRRLRWVQSWIHKHILLHASASSQSFAYVRGGSVSYCAVPHSECRWLVKLDIRGFFSSIHERHVYAVFRSLGYGALISFEMARICTRIPTGRRRDFRGRKRYSITAYSNGPSHLGSLPMGAPSSPLLSDLYMQKFDFEMLQVSDAAGLVYTRYADDLFFSSGSVDFNRAIAMSHVARSRAMLRSLGLALNEQKITICPPGARKIVLGLIVNESSPRLSSEFKKRMRQHYYFLKKFGPKGHADRRRFRSSLALERHLRGLIAFAGQIEPVYAETLLESHQSVDWPSWPPNYTD